MRAVRGACDVLCSMSHDLGLCHGDGAVHGRGLCGLCAVVLLTSGCRMWRWMWRRGAGRGCAGTCCGSGIRDGRGLRGPWPHGGGGGAGGTRQTNAASLLPQLPLPSFDALQKLNNIMRTSQILDSDVCPCHCPSVSTAEGPPGDGLPPKLAHSRSCAEGGTPEARHPVPCGEPPPPPPGERKGVWGGQDGPASESKGTTHPHTPAPMSSPTPTPWGTVTK